MPQNKNQERDYAELGRRLENIYLTGYISKKEMFKWSFLKGLATGVGGVVGATIVIALLAWTLSLFEEIPLIGPLFDGLDDTVKTQRK